MVFFHSRYPLEPRIADSTASVALGSVDRYSLMSSDIRSVVGTFLSGSLGRPLFGRGPPRGSFLVAMLPHSVNVSDIALKGPPNAVKQAEEKIKRQRKYHANRFYGTHFVNHLSRILDRSHSLTHHLFGNCLTDFGLPCPPSYVPGFAGASPRASSGKCSPFLSVGRFCIPQAFRQLPSQLTTTD